jgi:hypothetical protein
MRTNHDRSRGTAVRWGRPGLLTALALGLALAGCGGGGSGGDADTPAAAPAAGVASVPDSAFANTEAMGAFQRNLTADDRAEPLQIGSLPVPTDDHAEPFRLAGS